MNSSLDTTAPSEEPALEPLRDSYYLETVVFKVENTLFKVPRFQFERSRKFAPFGTLWLPQPVEGAAGTSDKTPFKLDGVSCLDFRVLLKVLYPLSPIPKAPDLNKDEWISVLKVANVFDLIEVRNLAIQELTAYTQTLECTKRILFAREYDVSAWLRSAYTELARRKTAISSDEAAKIGWDAALQIFQLREAAVASEGDRQSPYDKIDLGTSFEAELKRADSAHQPLLPIPQIWAANKLPKSSPAIGSAASSSNGAAPPTLFGIPQISAEKKLPESSPAIGSAASSSNGATPFGPSNPNPFSLDGFTFKGATSIFDAPLKKDPVTFKTHNSDTVAPVAPVPSGSGTSSSGPQTPRAAPPTLFGPSNPNPFSFGGLTVKGATSVFDAPLKKDPVTFKTHNSDTVAPVAPVLSGSGTSSSGPKTRKVVVNLPKSATGTAGDTASAPAAATPASAPNAAPPASAPTAAPPASASDASSGSGTTKNAPAEVMGS